MRLLLLSIVSVGLLAGGCAAPDAPAPAPARGGTYSVRPPHAVFDSPAMRQARAQRAVPTGQAAWWTGRNNRRLNVRRGAATASTAAYVVETRDRQQSFGDHIHNVYRRIRRSVEIGGAVSY